MKVDRNGRNGTLVISLSNGEYKVIRKIIDLIPCNSYDYIQLDEYARKTFVFELIFVNHANGHLFTDSERNNVLCPMLDVLTEDLKGCVKFTN